ncbi:hygromycin-B 4-O-kinase [Streptomyces jeddahensis]|uniref:Hygromycin-B 4-O-kinase n=1 Tax=Streptomyces jeddahensis TaxID=1716141 RepID=A0A177HTH0_9ACTN|nr:hygromycin-B 4-O-kinase [Streptomyces jeddahensis]
MLSALHSADTSGSEGYGVCVAPGKGACGSLREALLHGAGHDWERVARMATSQERQLLDANMAAVEPLLDLCPDIRMQFHGDFGLGNTLASNGVVTAVVDWTHQGYGDPLWDVACLDLWWPTSDSRPHICARNAMRSG